MYCEIGCFIIVSIFAYPTCVYFVHKLIPQLNLLQVIFAGMFLWVAIYMILARIFGKGEF